VVVIQEMPPPPSLPFQLIPQCIPIDGVPFAVTVNPVNRRAYLPGVGTKAAPGSTVTVINGYSLTYWPYVEATVGLSLGQDFQGVRPEDIAVNQGTFQIFVSDSNKYVPPPPPLPYYALEIIDGITNKEVDTPIQITSSGEQVVVDPVANIAYTNFSDLNNQNGGVDVVQPYFPKYSAPVQVSMSMVGLEPSSETDCSNQYDWSVPSDPYTPPVTADPNPKFTIAAAADSAATPTAFYYQLDTMVGDPGTEGAWHRAQLVNGQFSFQLNNVSRGVHIIYAFGTYDDEDSAGQGSGQIGHSPIIGNPDCWETSGRCATPYVFVEESNPTLGLAITQLSSSTYQVTLAENMGVWQACGYTVANAPNPQGPVYLYDVDAHQFIPGAVGAFNGLSAVSSVIPYSGSDSIVAVYFGDPNYQPITTSAPYTPVP
jgi:hypothetical protein